MFDVRKKSEFDAEHLVDSENIPLNQLFANINPENEASITLFTNFGFEKIGIKKQWNKVNNVYKDEALFQLINVK